MFSLFLKDGGMYGTIIPLPPGLTFALYGILTIGYLIGAEFNLMLRAGFAYRSQVNVYPTRRSFYTKNWDTILIRVALWGYGLFYIWTLHPDWLSISAVFFHVPKSIADWLTFPVSLGTAVGAGFVIDVILDSAQSIAAFVAKDRPYLSWLPAILGGRIPEYNPRVVNTKLLKQDDIDAKALEEKHDNEDEAAKNKLTPK